MKNLFKNLMLVAVAAMAFTACQNDNEDVNRVNETTVVEFKAEFDTTRSGFNEKDDEGYSSHWDGGEAINLEVVSGGNVAAPSVNPTMEADGTFTAALNGIISDEGTITALIPAGSWKSEYNYDISGYEMVPSIPLVQTPETGSVDAAAHILKAVKTFEGGLGGVQELAFAHQVAYAKMTLNTEVAIAEIAQVIVEIDAQRYTLIPTSLTEPTFWFACEEATPTAMTVTITAENGSNYVKELDLANATQALTFENGVVSTFTVGGFEKVTIADVKSISASYNDYDNTFTFNVTEKNGGMLFLPGIQFNEAIISGMLPVEDELDVQYTSEKVYWTDANGTQKWIRSLYIAVNQEAEGYTITFAWSTDGTNEVPAEYDYADTEAPGLTYTGIISGINNPPVPESVAVTTAPESVNGRANNDGYDYTYYLSFVAGDWTITDLYFYAPVSSNGIIPEGEQTIRGGTATLTDTTWAFDITYGGTLTVAYSGENYVLTFAFEDANNSTYNFSFTGVIAGDNGIYQPGAATPLATPTNVAYELVDFTKARITWDAVSGAGSYQLYYNDGENDSEPVTTNTNSYTFEDLTIGKYYTVYVKALPADETKNTASENYGSVYNVKVFADHSSMNATYTFNTVEKTGKNTFKFSDGVDNLVIGFLQELENVPAGTYYGGYYEPGKINPYDCSLNGGSIFSIDYVVVEGNYGEEQTVTIVFSLAYGEDSIKAVFTGVLEEESNASTYVATSFQYQDDNNGSARLYKMVGDNFDINIWVNWNDDNDGTLSGDTLSYCYCPSEDQVENYVYGNDSMWFCGTIDGAELSNNHYSTLAVSGNTATLTVYDANGSLLAVITAQL